MDYQTVNDQCRQCTNCCRVRFELDEAENVVSARRKVFSHRGVVMEACPNLARAEGRRLEDALELIHCRVMPKIVLSGH